MSGSTSSGNILKEFFISLAYKVDGTSKQTIDRSIEGTTNKLLELGKRAAQAAAAVVAAIALIARALEDLYYASRRTGAAAENIRAFGYAVSQLGGTAGGALTTLENFARFLRSSPGSFAFLERLGIQTRTATGSLRDTSEMLLDVGRVLRDMPRYRANAYADILGIDELTLNAMIDGTEQFSDAYREMAARMGVDGKKAAEGGMAFTRVMRELFTATSLLRQRYNQELAGPLGVQLQRLTKILVDNADVITQVLTNASRLILALATFIINAMVRAVEGLKLLYKWFTDLPIRVQQFTVALGGLLLAWRALSAGFAASPLGRLVLLLTAFLLLLEDYATFNAGGKSAIDWGAWEPQIKAVESFLGDAKDEALHFLEIIKALGKELGFDFGQGFMTWVRGFIPAVKQVAVILGDLLDVDAMMSAWDLRGGAAAGRNLARSLGILNSPREEVPGRPGSRERGAETGRGASGDSARRPIGAGPQVMLNLLGESEGTDRGRGYNETLGYGRFTGGEVDLTGMTLDQIDELQTRMLRHPENTHNSSAVGRYQIVQSTMRRLRAMMGLNGSERYDKAMQDQMAMRLMEGRGLERYRRGEITQDEFINELAKEWASVPRADTGQGHYPGQRRPGASLGAFRGAAEAMRTTTLVPAPSGASGSLSGAAEEPLPNPSITSSTVINVNGAGDPSAVAGRVADAQQRVNADLVRNTRGALR